MYYESMLLKFLALNKIELTEEQLDNLYSFIILLKKVSDSNRHLMNLNSIIIDELFDERHKKHNEKP